MNRILRDHTGRVGFAAGLLFSLLSGATLLAQTPPLPAIDARTSGPSIATNEVGQDQFQYIFFWKQDDPQTRGMLKRFKNATQQMAPSVTTTTVNISDPRQRKIVDQYNVGRAPMPLVLSIAANGAVTKAWPVQFTAEQLREGIVSHHAAQCLKALQDKKLVVLCVLNSRTPISQSVYQSAVQFQADSRFVNTAAVIAIDANDAAEGTFLQQLQVTPGTTDAVTIVLAPPGEQVAKFSGPVTKEQLAAKVTAAQSACCPGGKCGANGQCGPGGCCPGGKCGPQPGRK